MNELRSVTSDVTSVDWAAVQLELDHAEGSFATTHRRVGDAWLQPLRWVPWVGTQLRALDGMSSAAVRVTAAGSTVAATAEGIEAALSHHTLGRVEAMEQLHDVLEMFSASTDPTTWRLGPRTNLLPQLARAHEDVATTLSDLHAQARDGADITGGMASFLRGGRYLVLLTNPSEARVGGGMILQLALLTTNNGELQFEAKGSVSQHPARSELPILDRDVAANWGFLEPSTAWQNLNMTPRFPVVARHAKQLWESAGNEEIDGVLMADPAVLAALLRLTGPVTVAGKTLTADNAREFIGRDQYLTGDPASPERKDMLAELATLTMTKLTALSPGDLELLQVLKPAVADRNLQLWSADEVEQRGWQATHADGDLGANEILVSVSNHNPSKLDYYLQVDTAVDVREESDGSEMTLTVTLTNTAPEALPVYAAGSMQGDYFGLLILNTPSDVTSIRIDESAVEPTLADTSTNVETMVGRIPGRIVEHGRDGPENQVAVSTLVPRNGSAVHVFVLRFDGQTRPLDVGFAPTGRWPKPTK